MIMNAMVGTDTNVESDPYIAEIRELALEFLASRPHLRTEREKADALGIQHSSLKYFLNGEKGLSLRIAMEVLHRVGGDFRRALPTYSSTGPTQRSAPPRKLSRPRIYKAGRVIASDGSVGLSYDPDVDEPLELGSTETVAELCSDSPYWSFVSADRPIWVFVVEGDSMSPAYSDGCWIFTAKPNDPSRLPDGSPVIMRNKTEDWYTFKQLQWVRSPSGKPQQVWGVPATTTSIHPIVKWPFRETEIHAVVLGAWMWPKLVTRTFRENKAKVLEVGKKGSKK